METIIVKEKYSRILRDYNKLSATQKIKLESYLNIFDLSIKYVDSWDSFYNK
jgi:hypothetical protein